MSALSCIIKSDAAYVFTDTANYDLECRVQRFMGKVETIGAMPAITACRGPAEANTIFSMTFADCFSSFDDLIEGAEGTFAGTYENWRHRLENEAPRLELVIAGWSKRRGRAKSYIIVENDYHLPIERPDWLSELPHGKLTPLPAEYCSPAVLDETAFAAGFDRFPTPQRMELLGAALLEMQRHTLAPNGRRLIGGTGVMHKITASGVTRKEICRWPDDQIGEFIGMEPTDWDAWRRDIGWPGALPSRAERRRALREARR